MTAMTDWALINVDVHPVELGGIKLVLTAPRGAVKTNEDGTVRLSVVLDRESARRTLIDGVTAELDRQEGRTA